MILESWLCSGLPLAVIGSVVSMLVLSSVGADETIIVDAASPQADDAAIEASPPLRSSTACPTDLEALTALLLRDIPSYTNRVLQRSVGEVRRDLDVPATSQYRPPYVLIASQPELAPLDISDRVYTTPLEAQSELQQIFFSTLERQYTHAEVSNIELLHWLFLAPAEDGWHLAFMFSTIDDDDSTTVILPPRESSNGSVGKAVQLWLRDCRANDITPLE